jgi:hypothetical protein
MECIMMALSSIKTFDVYLTGGGLKGAYQYGFFKRFYEILPDVRPNRVFGSSVGALNAIPVLLGRMDILKEYWQNDNGRHPFDCIMERWNAEPGEPGNYTLISNMHRVAMYKSMFVSINRQPFEDIWDGLTPTELSYVRDRLSIVTFDPSRQRPVFLNNFADRKEFADAITATTRCPGLVHIQCDNMNMCSLMDGIMCDHDDVVDHIVGTRMRDETVLVLDIHDTHSTHYMHDDAAEESVCTNTNESLQVCTTFSPSLNAKRIFAPISFCASRQDMDDLIRNGEDHATRFVKILQKI